MSSPVRPSQLQAVIPSASGSVCDKFQRAFKTFPQLVSNWFSYAYNEDGSFTDAYKADVCAIDCAALAAGGGPVVGASLAIPTLVQGAPSNSQVNLQWTAIPGATFYELIRNTANCLYGATFVGYTTSNTFADTAVAGSTYYYYWLRAMSNTNQSAFSAVLVAFTSGSSSLPLVASTTTASNTTIPDYIAVSWTAVQGAESYDVFRNGTNTLVGATLLGNTAQRYWNDYAAVPATAYYMLVTAKNHFGLTVTNTGVLGSK